MYKRSPKATLWTITCVHPLTVPVEKKNKLKNVEIHKTTESLLFYDYILFVASGRAKKRAININEKKKEEEEATAEKYMDVERFLIEILIHAANNKQRRINGRKDVQSVGRTNSDTAWWSNQSNIDSPPRVWRRIDKINPIKTPLFNQQPLLLSYRSNSS